MKSILPSPRADPAYLEAFREVMKRLEDALGSPRRPVTVCLAGGAAVHMYTGSRVSKDIDAKIMARFIPPEGLEVSYRDEKGHARLLYFDTQYNDTFGLLHADAYNDALPLPLEGIDPGKMDLKILTPLDLAVSKLSRYETQDQEDIRALAEAGLFTGAELTNRAEEALPDYVGNLDRVKASIALAEKLVSAAGCASSPPSSGKRP
jgi:hypothetical protein